MPFNRHIIAPYEQGAGLQTNKRPWLITDNAFSQMVNLYAFRSRLRKRFGTTYLLTSVITTPSFPHLGSRVFHDLGVSALTVATGMVPGDRLAASAFSIGNVMFTVISLAAGPQQMLRTDGLASTATYDSTTGNYNITNVANGLTVKYYTQNPIQAIEKWELGAGILGEPVIAFDTQFAYQWAAGTGWQRIGTSTTAPGAGIWSGTEIDYYSVTTFRGTANLPPFFFVVNNNPVDRIQYLDNTGTWVVLPALVNPTDHIASARFILSFKNRLVLLNTWEVAGANPAVNYRNRIRYSALGNSIGATAFYDIPVTTGYGGFLDNLGTEEEIIGYEFLLDRLIVYFEHSTWEIAYTGSEAAPFVFQKISTEYGANAQNSTIPESKNIYTFSTQGIHACTGVNVFRIDSAIPQLVYDIKNEFLNGESYRTCGIRDFDKEMIYWAYVSAEEAQGTLNRFPNRVLTYNYITKNWAYNIDTFTAFGHFPPYQIGTQRSILLGGNQQGYIVQLDADAYRNASALQITNITYTLTDIILQINDNNIAPLNISLGLPTYIVLENITGTGTIPTLNNTIFPVVSVTGNTITIANELGVGLTGTYNGGGAIAQVSNYDLSSKEFNPYVSDGKNIFVGKIEFQVDKTNAGEVTLNYFTSTSTQSTLLGSIASGAIIGTNKLDTFPYPLYPLEATSTRIWHPVYFQSSGECLQFRIFMTDEQMRDPLIAFSNFELHSMTLYSEPTGRTQ